MSKNTAILILVIIGFVILGFFLNRFLGNIKYSHGIRIGFSGHQTERSISYKFFYFTGRKRLYINAIEGEKIKISYDASLKGGKMVIHLISPEGKEIWKCEVNKEEKGSKVVKLQIPGVYILEVEAKNARSGKIEFYWEKIIGI